MAFCTCGERVAGEQGRAGKEERHRRADGSRNQDGVPAVGEGDQLRQGEKITQSTSIAYLPSAGTAGVPEPTFAPVVHWTTWVATATTSRRTVPVTDAVTRIRPGS